MNISETSSQHEQARSGRPILKSLAQRARLSAYYKQQLPWWRRSYTGYLATFPLASLGLFAIVLLQKLGDKVYFPSAFLLLVVLLTAMIWGLGPSLFSVLICTLVLNYFYVSPGTPLNLLTRTSWLEMLPFVLSGLIVAMITGQRELARQKALLAERDAQEQSHELAILNAKLKEVNRELEQANILKDQFLSMASHELKTPITTIRGQAQVMLRRLARMSERPAEFEMVRESLAKIDQQTYRLNSLVDDLLDITRIRSGKIEFRMSKIDLSQICREVIDEELLFQEREVEFEAPQQPVRAYADAERLHQVVVNLVSNAIKYSKELTPVRVVVEQNARRAILRVHNFGSVIPEDQQARIFEMFYRAPDAAHSTKKGSGLGLAISKEIVEGHGGRIWCESSEEAGTTFTVELPQR